MRKADLVKTISNNTGLNKVDVLLVLENSFREIKKAIADKKIVSIRGFGTFTTKLRAAKKGRIVKKNIEINLPAKTIPFFKPAKEFSNLLILKTP